MNPEGESRHRHSLAKMARKERENQTRMEKKVNRRRHLGTRVPRCKVRIEKVARVESDEAQDYVRDSLNLSREEAEVSCQARSAFHEGLCFGLTIAAVTKPSDSGSLLAGFLGAVEDLAVEGSRGKESASWQTMENVG